jgi:hypothetical protein
MAHVHQHHHSSPQSTYQARATTKVPPAWHPGMENQGYPFRDWMQDVMMWAIATDLRDEQMGGAVALQLSGAARILIRALDASTIAMGDMMDLNDGMGSRPVNGLTVVLKTLQRRYGNLTEEDTMRCISEMLSFRRLKEETIDEMLSRFEVLRHKSIHGGGMNIGPSGFAWLLLKGMQMPPERWVQLLHLYGGNLPADEGQFLALMEQIRRQGHLYQNEGLAKMSGSGFGESHARHHGHQHPLGQPGHQFSGKGHFLGMPSTDPIYDIDPWSSSSLGAGAAAAQGSSNLTYAMGNINSGPADPWLGYLGGGDDASSSGTDDDDVMPAEELNVYISKLGVSEPMVADALFQEYVMARKRWRSYTGKTPRFARRNHRQGKGGFQPTRRPGQYVTHGKGTGKGRRNPTGRDGQVMKCHNCQSETHLIKDCPQNSASASRPAFVASHSNSMPATNAPTVQGNGVLAGISVPAVSAQTAGSAYHGYAFTQADRRDEPQQGLHFFTSEAVTEDDDMPHVNEALRKLLPPAELALSIVDESLVRVRDRTTLPLETYHIGDRAADLAMVNGDQIALTRDVASGEEDSLDDEEDLRWEQELRQRMQAGEQNAESHGADVPQTENTRTSAHREGVRRLIGMLQAVTRRPAARLRGPEVAPGLGDVSNQYRGLFYPTFAQYETSQNDRVAMWHARARLEHTEALLVDVGAHDNLTGDAWVERMEKLCREHGLTPTWRQLNKPMGVEGVGTSSQTCTMGVRMPVAVSTGEMGTFSAPVIPNSNVPALLGMKTLKKWRAMIDVVEKKLYLMGPGSVKVSCPPGSRVYDLQESPSGHLMLPVSCFAEANANMERVDFVASATEERLR